MALDRLPGSRRPRACGASTGASFARDQISSRQAIFAGACQLIARRCHNAAMDPAVANLCKATDPTLIGQRLRRARQNAGLTIAQVASGVVSAPFVSRLETGRRRADPEVLAKLADKIGMPLAQLVAPPDSDVSALPPALQLEIDYAELSLASGDTSSAGKRVASLLANPSLPAGAAMRQVRRLEAGVLEARAELREAITVLEGLTQVGPRDLSWIRDLIALTRCRRDIGDLQAAASVGDSAEELIVSAGLDGTTEAVQLALTVATARAEMGDVATAMSLCQQAISKADAIGSPQALASAYWNASIYESRQGNPAGALPLARRALAEFERGDDARNLGRLRMLVGQLMLKLESPPLDEAIRVLTQARRELEWSSAGRIELARNDLALARAMFRSAQPTAAHAHLDAALDVLKDTSPALYAHALILQGQAAFSAGDRATARARYQTAVTLLTGVGGDRTAGELWYELAALLESVGDEAGALAAYRSAAASAGFAVRPFEAAAQVASAASTVDAD